MSSKFVGVWLDRIKTLLMILLIIIAVALFPVIFEFLPKTGVLTIPDRILSKPLTDKIKSECNVDIEFTDIAAFDTGFICDIQITSDVTTKEYINTIYKIKTTTENYLSEHPHFFLSNGKRDIAIDIYCSNISPRVPHEGSFIRYFKEEINKKGGNKKVILSDMYILSNCKLSDFSDFKGDDIDFLAFDGEVDDINILKNFKNLQTLRINDEVSQSEINEIKELLPNCELLL